MALKSYNSSYPKAYYNIGTAYTFYYHKDNNVTLRAATPEEIQMYSEALNKAIKENSDIDDEVSYSGFRRAIGIVTDIEENNLTEKRSDKNRKTQANFTSYKSLCVMFRDKDGNYTINKL